MKKTAALNRQRQIKPPKAVEADGSEWVEIKKEKETKEKDPTKKEAVQK